MSLLQRVVAGTCLQGVSTLARVFLNVVAGTCLQGGLHWPVSLPQNVVTGIGLQEASSPASESFSNMLPLGHVCRVGLHWPVSLPQHVAAGTCLQGGSPLASESSSTCCRSAGTCLQGGSPLASESSLTGYSWDMSSGAIYTVQ